MYRSRLQRDLSLWVEKGLLPEATASALLAEYDVRPSSFSLGRVLAILSAILIGAAVIVLIAANWEAIPRLVRLVGIVGVLWSAHFGGAYFLSKGAFAPGQALLVVGALSFGGAISLVGQMYHLSGDQQSVMYLWFALAAVSAALFRAGAVTGVAALVGWASFATYLDTVGAGWRGLDPWAVPLMVAILIWLVRLTEAGPVRHIAYLLLVGWLTWLYSVHENTGLAYLYAVGGMAMLVALSLPPLRDTSMIRSAGMAPTFYSFLMAILGFLLLHDKFWNEMAQSILLALLVLGAAVVALVLQGRDNGAVRWFAYVAFASEVLYLAGQTVGSMLGTSGLFLASGLFVALLAYAVVKAEKLFGRNKRADA